MTRSSKKRFMLELRLRRGGRLSVDVRLRTPPSMRIALAVLLIVVCLPLSAQTPYLVKDINLTTNAIAASSSPANFIRFGQRIYFSATTTTNGTELWSTDGTQSGTALFADINRGSLSSNPSRFVLVNGHLLFNAREPAAGEELWTTDGTAAGTRLLADIFTGSATSSPGDRILYHGQLIFAANDGVDGIELWITDGTPAGTRFLKDLNPGADGSNPQGFVAFNDVVYFAASDGLWKTDGTANGTVRVKGSVAVSSLTVTAFGLFFSGSTASDGVRPWVSDGTENGTHSIGTPAAGNIESQSYATAFGDRVLFIGFDKAHGDELWISDGTAEGTHVLRDVYPGVNSAVTSNPFIAVAGGVAFFSAIDAAGSELWKTDGTEAGTTMVRDFPDGFGRVPTGTIALGSNVLFRAPTTPSGTPTLWTSDGTAAGTRQINASPPIAVSSPSTPFVLGSLFTPPTFTAIDGRLYFAGANSLNGIEPWKSDGTDSGTSMIANLTADSAPSSAAGNFVAAEDWVYFEAWDGSGQITQEGLPWSLWRSDGTPEGTMKISDSTRPPYIPIGRSLLFNKGGVWMTDGTPEGTGPATDVSTHFPEAAFLFSAWGNTVVTNLAGHLLYFAGSSLWTTDGTAGGTYAIVPNLGEFAESGRAVMGGYVFFSTRSSLTSGKLWKTEGTFEGSVVVKTLPGVVDLLSAAGRNLFFTAGGQLWVSDGTEAGTHSLPATPAKGALAAIGDSVVFAAGDATTGTELWTSDGTPAGTHLVADLYPGTFGSSPTQLTSAGGLVYFSAYDDLLGAEPWVTDGTAAGTKLVADIEPGLFGSIPQGFVQAGDRLFFDATTTATGAEPWALPLITPRLTIDDVRVIEGDSGSTNARFTLRLSPAPSKSVTIDYATADGTATAGSDYTQASGTVTFAAGETSRNIDVAISGDTTAENNETFFLTLKNAAGATLARNSAFAVIDDDDQSADVALSLAFSRLSAVVNASNSGPRAATNFKYSSTGTPGEAPTPHCSCDLSQLPSGTGAPALRADWSPIDQQYFTTTITARQRDPQPANNTVAWTAHGYLAMDALYLTPGSQANLFISVAQPAQYAVDSSNPAVVSVPSSTTVPASGNAVFVAHAGGTGTATIRVLSGTSVIESLVINVVAAGTTPRWPGAIDVSVNQSVLSFDRQATFTIENHGTAPYSGAVATGLVTISSNGRELGRITLGAPSHRSTLAVYAAETGQQKFDVVYAGDANFLPSTTSFTMNVTRGFALGIASAQRSGTTVNIHIRFTGLPTATPTGTLTVSEQGLHPMQTPLTTTGPGVAEADVQVTGVALGPHTFTVVYPGDTHYVSSFFNVPLIDGRGRAVRH
jgi:ELWxxDGT repeat protein